MSQLPEQPEMGAPLPVKPAPAVLEFLALRRSASAITLAAPAPSASELADLLRLAARVPDHGKLHPWRFIILQGEGKAAFTARLEALANSRGDNRAVSKLVKLKVPPMGVAVVSSPVAGEIPEWEQLMSAAAVCVNLTYGAQAMGYGANWITDWYAYDPEAGAILGLKAGERVAGFVFLGTASEAPMERVRPDMDALTSEWVG